MRPKCACNLNSDPQQRGTSCSFSGFCHFPSSCSQIVPTPRGKCCSSNRQATGGRRHAAGSRQQAGLLAKSRCQGRNTATPTQAHTHTKAGDNTMLLCAGIEIRSDHKTGHFLAWPLAKKTQGRAPAAAAEPPLTSWGKAKGNARVAEWQTGPSA